MAIVVLVSIAAGAIVTLVRGPWMWGSLLVLPAAAGLTILCLYRVNDSLLRRSLQLAILLSCAAHLLILVMTSLTVIFGSDLDQEKVVAVRQPQRKIIISNKANRFVIKQPQKHTVTESKVEPKKQKTTTKLQPQTIPVEVQEKQFERQVVKRERERITVPRVEKKPSNRSRNVNQVKPKVSRAVANPSSSAQPNKQNQVTQKKSSVEPAKTELKRRVSSRRSNAQMQSPTSSMKSRQPKPLASRRETKAAKISQRKDQSTARIRRPDTQIPKVALKSLDRGKTSKSKPTATKVPRPEASEANVANKRAAKSASRKTASKVKTGNRPVVQSATSRNQRPREALLTNTNPAATQRQPVSRVPNARSELNAVTNPAAASAATKRVTPQPQEVAITRSTIGRAGAGRSRNLERVVGGEASPIKIASDASSKRRASRPADNITMTALQQSPRMERGRSETSQRVLRNQNVQWARRTGAAEPAESTLQAAAARIDSAMADVVGRTAAEKGDSMLDVGPTKVIPELTSDRRGGGGLPELSSAVAASANVESGRKSNQVPTVATQLSGEGYKPAPAAPPTALVAEQNDQAGQLSRRVLQLTNGATRGQASMTDPDSSEADANRLADAAGGIAERRRGSNSDSAMTAELVAEVAEHGSTRSIIPKAPNVDGDIAFGSEGSNQAVVLETDDDQGDDSATTEIVRRATNTVTGGSLMGTASKIVASSMAGMPLMGDGAGQRRRISDRVAVLEGRDRANAATRSAVDNVPNVAGSLDLRPEVTDNPTEGVTNDLVEADSRAGKMDRQQFESTAVLPTAEVDINSEEGIGGLAETVSRRAGSVSDSITDADALSLTRDARFKRREFGGLPSVVPDAAIAKKAFRSRNPAALADSGPQTEAAIELGLEFLTRYQLADGSWTLGQFDTEDPLFQNQLNSDTAATGLALLAFQGAGYNHRQYKYSSQLKQAVDWLVANQSQSGGLYVETDKASNQACLMYSHAIAALALTEAYGMTQDPDLREPTQKALNYIESTQHAKKGGWRYFADRRRSTDTSVTGWMMMALKSGRLAGLDVDDGVLEKIDGWLRVAEDPNAKSQFRYNPYAADTAGKSRAHGRKASTTMTSVGLLMRVYTGWGPTDPRFLQGTDALLKQLPGDQDSRVRDTYYWYYATQVMKHAGGNRWEQWNDRLQPLLVGTQETSGPYRGSWHPFKPVPDRWGPQGGRLYVTTLNLLSLEVKYRLLPLYENTINTAK